MCTDIRRHISGIRDDLLKTVLDVDNPRMFSVVVEQVSFVILLIIEIGRASSFLPSMQMSAQKLFVLSSWCSYFPARDS